MSIGLDTTASNIKPLNGSTVIRGICGETIVAGNAVTLQSDGYWDQSDGNSAQLNVGVAVQGGVAGDQIDIVVHGPVQCVTGGTPAAQVYISDTDGDFSESVGTKDTRIGFVLSSTVVFVQPQIIDWS